MNKYILRNTLANMCSRAISVRIFLFFTLAIACMMGVTIRSLADKGPLIAGASSSDIIAAGDISLKLILLAGNKITANEPVLARLEIFNLTGQKKELNQNSFTYYEILDGKGKTVAALPKPRWPLGDRLYGPCYIEPGKSYTGLRIISGLYMFENPGKYTIKVQQLELSEGFPVIAENAVTILVKPRNAAQLDACCEKIFHPVRTHSSHETGIPMDIRIKALYSVHDDVVLPYLEWIALEYTDSSVCNVLRQFGTKQADKLLNTLAARTDKVGEIFRKYLSKPPFKDVRWNMGPY